MKEKAEGSQAGKGLKSKGGFKSIYLGGSASTSKWRENIAIPILKKHGIKYSSPQKELWKENLILSASENNELLLFVITKDTRLVAEMTLASYYIGLGCPMVMCIQSLDADAEIDGEKQSGQAVKDYNRGRVYLLDLAKSAGVPVFDDIMQAVNSTAEKYLAASK